MKFVAIIISFLLVIPVFGQRKKKDGEELLNEPTYVEGIPYALPRTGIRLTIKTMREDFVPGPYASYAGQLLGLKNVKTVAETKWTISVINVETFSEPDPEQVYKAYGDFASLLNLASDGCLVGLNAGYTNAFVKPVTANKIVGEARISDGFAFENFNDTPFYIPGDSTNGYRPLRVGVEQKAAEAAQKVLDCRMNQYDLAAGLYDDFPTDGEAYKVSMKELKNIEKNYLSLFAGRTTGWEDVFSFDFVPKKGSGRGEVIFRISDEKGVVPADDLSGKPVMLEFKIEESLTKKITDLAKSDNPNAGESGIYYRIPGTAEITVLYELNTISKARVTVAQFGTVAPFPENLLDGSYAIELHPETGAIKSVSAK